MKVGRKGFRGRNIWRDMKKRCNNPKSQNYGGRGIGYDPEWETFEGFWEDMGEGYSDNLSLERKDVNGNYCKENCEWIELKFQSKNKRRYSNNSLGIAGCHLYFNRGHPYVKAKITDTQGKRVCKVFSLKNRELEDVLPLLENWLKDKRAEYGYKESHGS